MHAQHWQWRHLTGPQRSPLDSPCIQKRPIWKTMGPTACTYSLAFTFSNEACKVLPSMLHCRTFLPAPAMRLWSSATLLTMSIVCCNGEECFLQSCYFSSCCGERPFSLPRWASRLAMRCSSLFNSRLSKTAQILPSLYFCQPIAQRRLPC